jgi:biotin carboxylase
VLKPRQGSASRDAHRVGDRDDLARLLAAGGLLADEEGGMILEGYLPTTDHRVSRFAPIVSVESYVSGGELHHFAVTGRLAFAEPFRETGSVLPSDLSSELASMAEATAAEAIAALGATYGCFHTEMKFTADGPRIIEVNGRIGGGIPEMVELAGGNASILRLAMELALGLPSLVQPCYSRIGWWRALTPPVSANRIETITGLEELKHLPGVDHVIVNRGAGEAVDWRQGYRDFVVQVYGSGRDYEEVAAAQLLTPPDCACQAVRERIRFQARSSAPWRIGSSTKRHDRAAIPILAATCRAARGRFSVELAGEVRMITG